jgi:hypothetical protein
LASLWPFKRPAPSIEDSARHLAQFRCLNERERRKARARLMREEMGLPPLEALR